MTIQRLALAAGSIALALWSGSASAATWEDILQKLYPAAKQEGQLVFNTERIEEVGGKQAVAAFSKRYPGIKLSFSGLAGAELPARLTAEAKSGRVSIDIFRSDPDRAEPLVQRGLLMKLDPHELTDQSVETYMDGHFIKLGDFISNFAYNTDVVDKSDVPKSYEDLLNPKWKHRLALDARGGQIAHLLSDHVWSADKFWSFVQGLKDQDPIWTTRDTEAMGKIVSGEAAIGTGSYAAIENLKNQGAPIEFLFLSPSLSEVRGSGIMAAAPHPNAAKLFLGWLLSPEGLAFRDKLGVGVAVPGTNLYRQIKERGADIIFEKSLDQILARDKVGEEITRRWGALK